MAQVIGLLLMLSPQAAILYDGFEMIFSKLLPHLPGAN